MCLKKQSLNSNVIKRLEAGQALFNCRVKEFPGFSKVTVFSHAVFNPSGHEVVKSKKNRTIESEKTKREYREDNLNRARDKAFEIAFANEFDYFVTFTLDSSKIDRYDKQEILKKFKVWLQNKVVRNDLKYIIFPEYHKDGAIHFHGLCSGDLQIIDSGLKTKRGQNIYNSESWKYGFSSVVKIEGPYARVVNYVMKYISKDNKKVFGKHYFAGGR
ncbi:MAG: hypothetical protein ABRQ26_12930, partial [Syntrophomonadaceae bacterium]